MFLEYLDFNYRSLFANLSLKIATAPHLIWDVFSHLFLKPVNTNHFDMIWKYLFVLGPIKHLHFQPNITCDFKDVNQSNR